MLECGRSKSFIEPHCSSLLWALFILKKLFVFFGFQQIFKKTQKNIQLVMNVRVILSECLFVCVSNLTEYTILEQHARCNRRVQEVVRVKQKKIKIESFSNGLNHRGSFCGVRFGSNFFAESPCELRFCVSV